MSIDQYFRGVGAEALADLLPLYYTMDKLLAALDQIESCINQVIEKSKPCISTNFQPCILETLETLEPCYMRNMREFSSAFSETAWGKTMAIGVWMGGKKGTERWSELLTYEVYPFIGIADGIIRFLISQARLIAGLYYEEEKLRRIDLETVNTLKPAVDTILAAKNVKINKARDYFLREAFTTLLKEAKSHIEAAKDKLTIIMDDIRRMIDQVIKWHMGRKIT